MEKKKYFPIQKNTGRKYFLFHYTSMDLELKGMYLCFQTIPTSIPVI